MSFYNRLKMKFQCYAVRNLALYATVIFAVGYLLMLTSIGNSLYMRLFAFLPREVLHGQVWRIVTALLYPPFANSGLFGAALGLYVYYNFASTVERSMGEFEFNLYFFSSYLIGELAMIVFYLIFGLDLPFLPVFSQFSVFMAFSILYPDLKVYLFFLIPVRSAYIALAQLVIYVYEFIRGNAYTRTLIIAAFVHAAIFYIIVNRRRPGSMSLFEYFRNKKRQAEWKKKYNGG